MTPPIRIIYAGTPDFAVPPLEALVEAGYEVVAVYTQPDRPAGRGREPRPSPVKQQALSSGIPVYQPETLRDAGAQRELASLEADLMIVTAYGLILPTEVLETPRLGCINIHASLLPRWRGAAPIQRAILAGDDETGITIMQMDEGLDTGAMLAKDSCAIEQGDTGSSLHDRLMVMGAQTLLRCLPDLIDGRIDPVTQDDALATYASKLSKAEAQLNWSQSAEQLERSVRAYNAWPVAYTHYIKSGKKVDLRVWQSEALEAEAGEAAGIVIGCGKNGIDVVCGDGVLRLTEVQPAGKRVMSAADFSNSNDLVGTVIGGD